MLYIKMYNIWSVKILILINCIFIILFHTPRAQTYFNNIWKQNVDKLQSGCESINKEIVFYMQP